MATIIRYRGDTDDDLNGNTLVDLSSELSGACDESTTQFLPHPVVNVEYDDNEKSKHKGETIYLEPKNNGAVWYIVLTVADVKKILKALR
jgi:hypothetical protein